MKHAQLHLRNLDPNLDIEEALWKLDERTIRVGRQGLAQARAALARSAQRERERERFEQAA
jgi:DNA topoisomerase IB